MNLKLKDERTSLLAFFACFMAYAMISMTKNTYSAAIAAIVNEGLFSKSGVGVINAAFYLCYGLTQFFGGYLADRFSPFKMILICLIGSLLTNVAMGMSRSFPVMLIVWSLNGIAQFGVWPSIAKILSSVLLPEHRKKAMMYIALCYPSGTILSYLIAMIVLKLWSWPILFFASGISLLLVTFFFLWAMSHIHRNSTPAQTKLTEEKESKKTTDSKPIPLAKMLFLSGVLFLCVPAFVRCMLDVGLKSWVPTMIMETYSVSPSFASLLTIFLVFVNLFGVVLSSKLYPQYCKNIALAIGLFYLASLPLLLILLLTGKLVIAIVVSLLAIVTTFMTASSQLLNVDLPAAFSSCKKTGTIAGITNAFGCFGCMVANFLYGYTAEHFGWTITIFIWACFALLAVIFCLFAVPLWRQFSSCNK